MNNIKNIQYLIAYAVSHKSPVQKDTKALKTKIKKRANCLELYLSNNMLNEKNKAKKY